MTKKLGDDVRERLELIPVECVDSQRITVTGINSKLPGAAKIAQGVLQTIPNRQRGPVVAFGMLILGLLVGFAIAKGWKP